MTDADLDGGDRADNSTTRLHFSVDEDRSDIPGVVVLTLRLVSARSFPSANAVLVKVFIDGHKRHQRWMILGSSSTTQIFKTHYKYWSANGLTKTDARTVLFQLTYGKVGWLAPGDFAPLEPIRSSTFTFNYTLVNQRSQEESRIDNLSTAEHSKADDVDHESSLQPFYDAMSQHVDEEGVPTPEDRPATPSGEPGQIIDSTPRNTEDTLARLNRATKPIFKEDLRSSMEPVTASSPSPAVARAASVQESDTEMFDDPDSNAEKPETNETTSPPNKPLLDHLGNNTEQPEINQPTSRQKEPIRTLGEIDKYPYPGMTGGYFGIIDDNIDQDDEAYRYISNRKPIKRTSYAHPGATLQPTTGIMLAGDGETNKEASTSKGDTENLDEDETASATPPLPKAQKSAAQQLAEIKYRASGGRVKRKLINRLVENDGKIGGDKEVPKIWKGTDFGTDPVRQAENFRRRNIIENQVTLHELLGNCPDAKVAAEIHGQLQPWADDKIDDYERQLEAAISACRKRPSINNTGLTRKDVSDSVEGSDGGFTLPPLTGPQHGMAASLLSENQPVRGITESRANKLSASDRRMQTPVSRIPTVHSSSAPEESDGEDLPDFNSLLERTSRDAHHGKTPTAKDADGSEERPTKKPRVG